MLVRRKVTRRLSRLLRRPKAGRVRRMTIAVSWLCDCRCEMCGIWKIYREDPELRKTELTSDETVGLLTNSSSLRALEVINFTGGEPFIHGEFVPLALALEKHYPLVQMDVTTTGQATTLIREKLEAIADGGGDLSRYHVCVSLDGVEGKHDEIRGKRGAFDKAIETVRMAGSFDLGNLALGFTILPANYESLSGAYQLSRELGVAFTMRVAHFNTGMYDNADMTAATYGWTPAAILEVKATVRSIQHDMRRDRGLLRSLFASELYFADRMLEYLEEPRRMMPCHSGTHSALLDPHGNVYPCVNLDTNMGNAREKGFDGVWFSDEARRVREDIAAERCHCWTECESYLSMHTSPRYLISNAARGKRGKVGEPARPECLNTT